MLSVADRTYCKVGQVAECSDCLFVSMCSEAVPVRNVLVVVAGVHRSTCLHPGTLTVGAVWYFMRNSQLLHTAFCVKRLIVRYMAWGCISIYGI